MPYNHIKNVLNVSLNKKMLFLSASVILFLITFDSFSSEHLIQEHNVDVKALSYDMVNCQIIIFWNYIVELKKISHDLNKIETIVL